MSLPVFFFPFLNHYERKVPNLYVYGFQLYYCENTLVIFFVSFLARQFCFPSLPINWYLDQSHLSSRRHDRGKTKFFSTKIQGDYVMCAD